MAAASKEAPPATSELKREGAYLTNGVRLYRVLNASEGHVRLENCKHPEENGVWVSVRRILAERWRVVRPRS